MPVGMPCTCKPMARTLQQCTETGTRFLMAEAGLLQEEAKRESRLLVQYVLRLPAHLVFTDKNRPVSRQNFREFSDLVRRRAGGEPFAYLTGRKEFFSIEFTVDRHVLIPRPETEELVEFVLSEIQKKQKSGNRRYSIGHELAGKGLRILDVGTGSGNIAAALAIALPAALLTAVDISSEALEVARHNLIDLGLDGRVRLLHSDLMTALDPEKEGFEIIVSNPPYVLPEEYEGLEPELFYEPRLALVVENPEGFFGRFFAEARTLLCSKGRIFLESSPALLPGLKETAERAGFVSLSIHHDLSGRDRFLTGLNP